MTQTTSYHLYILQCADKTLYTGIAKDLKARLEKHSKGEGAKYTRARLPIKLVYSETLPDKSSALKREIEIKKLTRKEKLELIKKTI